jgi:hypothetical protein
MRYHPLACIERGEEVGEEEREEAGEREEEGDVGVLSAMSTSPLGVKGETSPLSTSALGQGGLKAEASV